MIRLPALTAALSLVALGAVAIEDYRTRVAALVEDGLRAEVATPELLAAVAAQNAAHAGLDQPGIDALDATWRAEIEAGAGAMVDGVLGSASSQALRAIQAGHAGLVTELFVMDAHGLIVGESDRTSDYWQADEAKFQKSFGVGPAAVFVDEVELDESTQTYQAQVSFTLVDPATGAAVGAVTAGIDVEKLP